MTYGERRRQWMVSFGQQLYGLHCGEHFQIRIGPHQMNCRLELGQQWYVIIENVRFNLRIQDHYRICL
jgi:hypothetical protein